MITNITIGQYYPANSRIHSLDPRVKLIATLLYIVTLFVVDSFLGYLLTFFCLSLVIYASTVPLFYIVRGLKAIVFLAVFTAVLNVFFTPGATVLWQVFGVSITLEGLLSAAKIVIRLILLIIGSSMLTLTTSPIQLTDAIEYLLKPFKKIGVPAHEIAMMMTIALRFIPTLMEELDKIMKAQMARGADFDTGGLMKKAKSLVPLLVPLFISSFRRADDLATAMEARCYRGDQNRTRMKQMKLLRRDYKAIGCVCAYMAVVVVMRVFL